MLVTLFIEALGGRSHSEFPGFDPGNLCTTLRNVAPEIQTKSSIYQRSAGIQKDAKARSFSWFAGVLLAQVTLFHHEENEETREETKRDKKPNTKGDSSRL